MLWTAVALLQRTDPGLVSVVYSGDGDAGKEHIIEKVKVRVTSRFLIKVKEGIADEQAV